MPGINEAQMMHDAYRKNTRQGGDENSSFVSEYSRQYYVDQLTPSKIEEQISLLSRDDYKGVTDRDAMLESLKKMKAELQTLQSERTALAQEMGKVNLSKSVVLVYGEGDYGDFHEKNTSFRYLRFPPGGAYIQKPLNGTDSPLVIWERDKKLHSLYINGKQYIKNGTAFLNREGESLSVTEGIENNKKTLTINKQPLPVSAVPASPSPQESTPQDPSLPNETEFQGAVKDIVFQIDGKSVTTIKTGIVGSELYLRVKLGDASELSIMFKKEDNVYKVGEKTLANYTVADSLDNGKRIIILTRKTATNLPSPAPAPVLAPAPVASQMVEPSAPVPAPAPAKKPRTAEQVIEGNRKFIRNNAEIITGILAHKSSTPEIKDNLESYLADPTNENIRAFQKAIGAKEDGDFRGKTLEALKQWDGVTLSQAGNGRESIENRVQKMKKVTLPGLGESYKDIVPEYDKDMDSIFLRAPYIDTTDKKIYNYIGIRLSDFEAGKPAKTGLIAFEKGLYTLTLIPVNGEIEVQLESASPPIRLKKAPLTSEEKNAKVMELFERYLSETRDSSNILLSERIRRTNQKELKWVDTKDNDFILSIDNDNQPHVKVDRMFGKEMSAFENGLMETFIGFQVRANRMQKDVPDTTDPYVDLRKKLGIQLSVAAPDRAPSVSIPVVNPPTGAASAPVVSPPANSASSPDVDDRDIFEKKGFKKEKENTYVKDGINFLIDTSTKTAILSSREGITEQTILGFRADLAALGINHIQYTKNGVTNSHPTRSR